MGLVYAAGYGVGFLLLLNASYLVARLGALTALVGALSILAATYLSLPSANGIAAALLFVSVSSISTLIVFLLDELLEQTTPDKDTVGVAHGVFLTMGSIAWVGVPTIAGLFIVGGVYTRILSVTAAMLSVALTLAVFFLHALPRVRVHILTVRSFLARLTTEHDLRRIFAARFALHFFFGAMSAYAAILLTRDIGFSVADIGIIFTCTQIPFILFELPLGYLADIRWGEKEILIIGLIIISIATIAISFVTSTSLLIWALVLTATRVGAACVDIGSETYFFKKVDTADADALSAYRMLFPLGYIAGPLFMSFALLTLPLASTFAVLGLLVLVPLYTLKGLKDTK